MKAVGESVHRQCPCCAANQITWYGTRGEYNLVRCVNCELVFVHNMPRCVNRIYSGQETEAYVAQDREIQRRYSRLYKMHLKRLLPINARALDVGCGAGNFLSFAKSHEIQATGFEIDIARVEHCRKQGLDVRIGTLPSNDLRHAEWDLVWMSHILEHVPNPLNFISHAAKLLRPGGLLCLLVPNTDSISARVCGTHQRYFIPPEHLTYWNRGSLLTLARLSGLETVDVFDWIGGEQLKEIAAYYARGRFRQPAGGPQAIPAAQSSVRSVRVTARLIRIVDKVLDPLTARLGGLELVGIFRQFSPDYSHRGPTQLTSDSV